MSVGVVATAKMPQPRPQVKKISWNTPAVWSSDPPAVGIPHQSIGWTDLSVTNLVTQIERRSAGWSSNSLRDTFAFRAPWRSFKKSTDLNADVIDVNVHDPVSRRVPQRSTFSKSIRLEALVLHRQRE